MEVSCEFPRDLDSDKGMIPQTESVTQKAPGTFNIRMDFFQNNSFNSPVSDFPLNLTLGEWLNVALTLENVDSNLKLVVPDCLATPTTQETDPTNYPLFADKLVYYMYCSTKLNKVNPDKDNEFGFSPNKFIKYYI